MVKRSSWKPGAFVALALGALLLQGVVCGATLDPQAFTSLAASFNPTSGQTVNIDTTANPPTMTGAFTFNGVVHAGSNGAVFTFDAVSIANGATINITGTRTCSILSKGALSLGGTINANANVSTGGPGGGNGNTTAPGGGNGSGGGPGGIGGGPGNGGGAGGAGFGGTGGSAGFGSGGGVSYGAAAGQFLDGLLMGGSGGGRSTYPSPASTNANGGGGGGGVGLGATGVLTVTLTGRVYCNGANGGTINPGGLGEGGGGGSGGGIIVYGAAGSACAAGSVFEIKGGNGGDGDGANFSGGGGGGAGGRFCRTSTVTMNGIVTLNGGNGGGGGFNGTAGGGGTNLVIGATAPANDMFAGRITLPSGPSTTNGTNVLCTSEAGEWAFTFDGNGATSASVWYTWSTAVPTGVVVDTIGSDYDTYLIIFQGNNPFGGGDFFGTPPGGVTYNNDYNGQLTSRVLFQAAAGVQYQILIGGINAAQGNFTMNLQTGTFGPPNDNFANGISVAMSSTTNGTNVDASVENGEPLTSAFQLGATVWYNFTAAAAGPVEVNTQGSDFDTGLGIFTGAAVNALTQVGVNDDFYGLQSRVTFTAAAGTTYRIQVGGYVQAQGNVTLNVIPGPVPPPNDNLANAISIAAGQDVASGSNLNATTEAGENLTFAGAPGGHTMWYSFTATAAGSHEINMQGSSYDTVLGVYTGAAYPLTIVGTNDDFYGLQSRVVFTATAGTNYKVQIGGYSTGSGNFLLTIIPPGGLPPPVNDPFAGAIDLTGPLPISVTGNNSLCALPEPGEPFMVSEFDGTNNMGNTLWWKYTPATSGYVQFDSIGSSMDSMLAIYTGSAVNALTLIGINDQGAGDDGTLNLPVTAGVTYYAQVDSWEGSVTGSLHLNLTQSQPPPANDNFADRIALPDGSSVTNASNVGSTAEPNEWSFSFPLTTSIWYSYTPSANGGVEINTFGSNFDTTLIIYTGTNPFGGASFTSNPPGGLTYSNDAGGPQSQVFFSLTAGTEYQVHVSGLNNAVGNVVLNVIYTAPPPNDDFVNAITLAPNGTDSGTNIGSTLEVGEPNPAGAGGDKSVWWKFTPTGTPRHNVSITTEGSGIDTVLGIYSGNSLGGLVLVGENDDDPGVGNASRVFFFPTAGTDYYLLVNGFETFNGQIFFTATGAITINSVFNQAPTADPRSYIATEDTPYDGVYTGSDPDGDALDFEIVDQPLHGVVVITDPQTGAFTYTADADYSGPDTYTFRVFDGVEYSAPAIIDVTVLPGPDDPILTVESPAVGFEGTPLPLSFSAVLSDDDGSEVLSFQVSSGDGIPFTLNNGTISAPGVYDLTVADLVGLTLSTPDNVDFTLTITAISTETTSGATASVSDSLNVIALDVSPTIALSGFYTPTGGLDPYTLVFGAVTDPANTALNGDLDPVIQYIVNWGDGGQTTVDVIAGVPVAGSVTHSYIAGTVSPTITVDIINDDGLHLNCGTLRPPSFNSTTIEVNAELGDTFNFNLTNPLLGGLVGIDTPVVSLTALSLPDTVPDLATVGLTMNGTTVTSLGASPSNVLNMTGCVAITLTATNNGGVATATLVINILWPSGHSNTPRILSVIANPNPALVGKEITFTAVAKDEDGDILACYWNFKDGGDARSFTATHTYTTEGIYQVELTVSDGKHFAPYHIDIDVRPASENINAFTTGKLTFDFKAPTRSSLILVGKMPVVSSISVLNLPAHVSIPGSTYSENFTLNAKGVGGTSLSLFSVVVTAPGSGTSMAKITLHLKSTDGTNPLQPSLFQMLAPLGFENKTIGRPGVDISVPVTIVLDTVPPTANDLTAKLNCTCVKNKKYLGKLSKTQ